MIERRVTLWLSGGPFVRIPVGQFDTMWRFVFEIIYDSQPWEIPSGATAILNGKKPDGNVFAFAGTISNNTVTVDADVQMTACAGDTICELSILADGKTVGTANFTLSVEKAPKSPDDVSSESTLPAYAEMLEMFSGDITNAVNAWLNSHASQIGGLSNEAKQALLTLLEKVAYVDDQGQTYLDALETALYPPANLVSISAVFNQGSAVIYDTDSLDTLKQYLVVTASYSDGSTATIAAADYTLSGTLTEGTSTITVSYGGQTATFDVMVTSNVVAMNVAYPYGHGQAYSDGGETTLNTANTEMTSTRPINSKGVVRIRVTNNSGYISYAGPYIGLSDAPVTGNSQSPTITYARLYTKSETTSGRIDQWGNGVSLDITYNVEDAGKYLIIYSEGNYTNLYNALTWEIQFEEA